MTRTTKTLGVAITSIVLIVFIGAARTLYLQQMHSTVQPHCLVQRTGTVAIRVAYPPELSGYPTPAEWPSSNPLLITKEDSQGGVEALVLEIRNRGEYWPLVDVIDHPDFAEHWSTSTFNGHDAAAMTGVGGATYLIPIGNRIVQINYDHSELSPTETALADKMMQGITISTTTEDVPYDHERVDLCPN